MPAAIAASSTPLILFWDKPSGKLASSLRCKSSIKVALSIVFFKPASSPVSVNPTFTTGGEYDDLSLIIISYGIIYETNLIGTTTI
jgi:hypothetical protein